MRDDGAFDVILETSQLATLPIRLLMSFSDSLFQSAIFNDAMALLSVGVTVTPRPLMASSWLAANCALKFASVIALATTCETACCDIYPPSTLFGRDHPSAL